MVSKVEREKEHFDKLALSKGSQWWLSDTPAQTHRVKIRAELAVSLANLTENKRVLEIGCSTGDFTEAVYKLVRGIEIVALDVSPQLISLARRKRNLEKIHFEIADVESLQYQEDYFDAVIGYAILHHLNLDKALPELKRVLKKSGKIFFAEPNMLNPQIFLERKLKFISKFMDVSFDETAFYRWRIKKVFESYGFENVKVIPFDFLHPLTPRFLIPFMDKLSRLLEKIYLIKEIAGSLLITGENSKRKE